MRCRCPRACTKRCASRVDRKTGSSTPERPTADFRYDIRCLPDVAHKTAQRARAHPRRQRHSKVYKEKQSWRCACAHTKRAACNARHPAFCRLKKGKEPECSDRTAARKLHAAHSGANPFPFQLASFSLHPRPTRATCVCFRMPRRQMKTRPAFGVHACMRAYLPLQALGLTAPYGMVVGLAETFTTTNKQQQHQQQQQRHRSNKERAVSKTKQRPELPFPPFMFFFFTDVQPLPETRSRALLSFATQKNKFQLDGHSQSGIQSPFGAPVCSSFRSRFRAHKPEKGTG